MLLHRAVLLLALTPLWAGCSNDSGSTAAAESEEISTPFTQAVIENLHDPADEALFGPSELHRRHFELLGHIAFEDSVLLGNINHVRARNDGTFLLVDRRGRSSHLFGASGEHVKTLDPTECDPGVNWRPSGGAFLSDGSIVVSNNDARSTIRFAPDGACDRFIEPEMNVPEDIAPLGEGTFITHEETFEKHWLTQRDSDGVEIRTFGGSTDFAHLNYRMGGSNYLIAFPGNRVVVGLSYFPAPMIYEEPNMEGRLLFDPPSFVRPAEEDIRDTRGMEQVDMMNEVRDFMFNHTLIHSVFRLSDASVMTVYSNGFLEPDDEKQMAIHISDLEGRSLTPAVVTYPTRTDGKSTVFYPVFAKDNLVFTVRPAEELPSGDWGNPGLNVWRFNPATGGG